MADNEILESVFAENEWTAITGVSAETDAQRELPRHNDSASVRG
jgi:hypothetical protein